MKNKEFLIGGLVIALAAYHLSKNNGKSESEAMGDKSGNELGMIETATGWIDKGLVMVGIKEPRGIRNNNPGNLENNGIRWQGLADEQTDSRFYQFISPYWGIRALARVLINYGAKGFNTPREIVNRYAPPFENDSDSYARGLAKALGVGLDTRVDLSYVPTLMLAVAYMIRHENGKQPYSAKTISDAVMGAL